MIDGLWLGTASGIYNPFLSDLGDYSARLASLKYPENFLRDSMFGNPSWAITYTNLQIWLGQLFPAGDNFNWTLMRQIFPLAIVFYLGFYLLGICLFQNRVVSFLFAFATGVAFKIGWGTWWGIATAIPVPRSFFDAFLPWLLFLVFYSFEKHVLRFPVMFIVGLLSMVHPVSALGWGGAIITAYAINKPYNFSLKKHFLTLLFLSFVFLIPLYPYIAIFIQPKPVISPEDASFFKSLFTNHFNLRFGSQIADTLEFLWRNSAYRPVFPLAIASAIITARLGQVEHCKLVRVCLCLLVGIFVFGPALSFCEEELAKMLGRLSVLHQMIRILRFSIPLCYIIIALGIVSLINYYKNQVFVRYICYLIISVLLVLSWQYYEKLAWYSEYAVAKHFGFETEVSKSIDEEREQQELRREAMLAIRQYVPIDNLVFSNMGDTAVRYHGLRSLVFSFNDGTMHFFKYDAQACREWLQFNSALKSETGYIDVWQASGAEWLITNRPQDEDRLKAQVIIVWRNKGFLLCRKVDAQFN